MSPEDPKPETNHRVATVSIRGVLTDDVFNLPTDIILTTPVDQSKLGKWYKHFNYNGLDSEGRWMMHYLVGRLDNAIEKAAELRSQGRSDLADQLIQKIRTVGDSSVSINSDLKNVFDNTHGNLDMCLAFFGFKRNSGVKNWIDFVIRTWGEQPVYNFR